MRPPAPIAPACSTARTRASRSRRSSSFASRGSIKPHDRAVVISTANGLKFTDFKVAYHSSTLAGMSSRLANKPVDLPNDYDAVRRAIDTAEKAQTVSR